MLLRLLRFALTRYEGSETRQRHAVTCLDPAGSAVSH